MLFAVQIADAIGLRYGYKALALSEAAPTLLAYGAQRPGMQSQLIQGRYHVIKTISKLALLITVVAILYLVFSGNLFSRSPFIITGQLLAVALSIWARRSFQGGQFSIHAEPSEGPLLSSGPYQLIRHPMYAAVLLLIWSSILGHLSLVTVVIGLIVTGVIGIRIMTEDKVLLSHFPEYLEYARTTKRIIPFII